MNVLVPGQADEHPTLKWFFTSTHHRLMGLNGSFGWIGMFRGFKCNCITQERIGVNYLNHWDGRCIGFWVHIQSLVMEYVCFFGLSTTVLVVWELGILSLILHYDPKISITSNQPIHFLADLNICNQGPNSPQLSASEAGYQLQASFMMTRSGCGISAKTRPFGVITPAIP